MTRFEFGLTMAGAALAAAQSPGRALIAITFDLEMSRNFPTWEQTHWDFEKGNLDAASKQYSLEAARRVKSRGGVMHFFAVGRVFEQEDIGWLQEIVKTGHPVGNHTYDHVNVLATKFSDLQFRFQRSPWLIQGATPAEAIANNIAQATRAMKHRLGIEPAGFRTPGGFTNGLGGRADVQKLLMAQGYRWVSGMYPSHPVDQPDAAYLPAALRASQPYRYPETGLIEIPMSPVSDINAFRRAKWSLQRYQDAVRYAVEWTIDNGAVYDLLCHPSCLGVVDPQFRVVDMVCDLVAKSRGRAAIVGLDELAKRAV